LRETLTLALSFLTAAGVGGAIGAYFQARFLRRTQVGQQEHELKKARYLCIILLMLAKLKPDSELPKLRVRRPDIQNRQDLDSELEAELVNAYIFAGDAVLDALGGDS
jgi:hypothetical protein